MKLLILVLALGINTAHLRGQDTLFEYKVHYITSKDLRYETEINVNQIFLLGKKPYQQQLHFKDNLKFEKRVFVAIDSFETIPGTYGFNPGGWLILESVNEDSEKYALIRFYKFMFLVLEADQKKFESEFEQAAGRYRYTALKNFQPDEGLLSACRNLSNRYFVMAMDDW